MTTPPVKLPDTPLTNPRSLVCSLAFHTTLLLLASLVVLTAVAPEDTPKPRVLHAELAPVDNRSPAEAGGGGPGELGGMGSPIRLPFVAATVPVEDEAVTDPVVEALLEEALPAAVSSAALQLEDLNVSPGRGVGVLPGVGFGGGGGSGGGSGGGVGRGVGPSTEFFGARESAGSFAYVIDRSGSMSQHHALDLAKQELLASLSQLPPDAEFVVIFYNLELTRITDPSGQAELMPATGENKAAGPVPALRGECFGRNRPRRGVAGGLYRPGPRWSSSSPMPSR